MTFSTSTNGYYLSQYRNQLPPLLIVRAGNDTAVINDSIEEFVTQAIAAGADFSLLNHAEARHGFDIFEDTPRTHAIIRETLEFMQANLSAE